MIKLIIPLALFFLLSCTSEKSVDVNAPKTSPNATEEGQRISGGSGTAPLDAFEITPSSPTRSSSIGIGSVKFNPSEARITWLVNGVAAISDQNTFSAANAKRGDTIQAIAVLQGREIFSNILTVKNDPPVISRIKILPEVFNPGDTLSVDAAATDADDDEISITFEWTINGEQAGTRQQIEGTLKRGDKVSIKVTPLDGFEAGRSVILSREIRNLPPVITAHTDYLFDGKIYSYQVKAGDPDGDTLIYSLKTAPSGMLIDKTSGLISWVVPKETRGKISVVVSVSDGNGGEAVYPFTVDMAPPR